MLKTIVAALALTIFPVMADTVEPVQTPRPTIQEKKISVTMHCSRDDLIRATLEAMEFKPLLGGKVRKGDFVMEIFYNLPHKKAIVVHTYDRQTCIFDETAGFVVHNEGMRELYWKLFTKEASVDE